MWPPSNGQQRQQVDQPDRDVDHGQEQEHLADVVLGGIGADAGHAEDRDRPGLARSELARAVPEPLAPADDARTGARRRSPTTLRAKSPSPPVARLPRPLSVCQLQSTVVAPASTAASIGPTVTAGERRVVETADPDAEEADLRGVGVLADGDRQRALASRRARTTTGMVSPTWSATSGETSSGSSTGSPSMLDELVARLDARGLGPEPVERLGDAPPGRRAAQPLGELGVTGHADERRTPRRTARGPARGA